MLIMDFPSTMWLLENENAKYYTLLLKTNNNWYQQLLNEVLIKKLFGGALKIRFLLLIYTSFPFFML